MWSSDFLKHLEMVIIGLRLDKGLAVDGRQQRESVHPTTLFLQVEIFDTAGQSVGNDIHYARDVYDVGAISREERELARLLRVGPI